MAGERRVRATVSVWSVATRTDWCLVAAASKRQAELMMIGRFTAELGLPARDVQVRARLATETDVDRARSYAAAGDESAVKMLKLIGIKSPASEDVEPDLPPVSKDQLVLL